MMRIELRSIGVVESSLTEPADAPKQGSEGAPSAWLRLDQDVADGMLGIAVGDHLLVLTWLHLAERDVLQVHPRGDPRRALRGVFATRSPARPNPIGVHPVEVLAIDGVRLRVGPLEAVDGTPVIDLKRG